MHVLLSSNVCCFMGLNYRLCSVMLTSIMLYEYHELMYVTIHYVTYINVHIFTYINVHYVRIYMYVRMRLNHLNSVNFLRVKTSFDGLIFLEFVSAEIVMRLIMNNIRNVLSIWSEIYQAISHQSWHQNYMDDPARVFMWNRNEVANVLRGKTVGYLYRFHLPVAWKKYNISILTEFKSISTVTWS